ncbi:MAG TPA: CBS domain-containing protein [Thermoanaerobaculia bacterium]|nr:CBS domain-containing protein [Thermoanaerobaculia bacterium]
MEKITVRDWMTANPITIDVGASIIEAMHVMKERGVRRLPVMRHGRLAGIVTDRMLKDYAPGKATTLDTWETHYLLAKTSVAEAMNPKPHCVTPESDLLDAAAVIRDHKLYGVCVTTEKGDLVGVLTIKDLIDALFHLANVAVPAR